MCAFPLLTHSNDRCMLGEQTTPNPAASLSTVPAVTSTRAAAVSSATLPATSSRVAATTAGVPASSTPLATSANKPNQGCFQAVFNSLPANWTDCCGLGSAVVDGPLPPSDTLCVNVAFPFTGMYLASGTAGPIPCTATQCASPSTPVPVASSTPKVQPTLTSPVVKCMSGIISNAEVLFFTACCDGLYYTAKNWSTGSDLVCVNTDLPYKGIMLNAVDVPCNPQCSVRLVRLYTVHICGRRSIGGRGESGVVQVRELQ